jgi:hypothetical protein
VRPNPAVESATIRFALPRDANVRLSILDIQGREVARLAEGRMAAGHHEATWAPAGAQKSVAPGVYLVRFETPRGVRVRRIVVE